ncbi:MAG: FHA domain-containing protein [Blastochloris sp.]|nr:FHA domain-containing protein [Blastochloris sp.]
MPSLIAKSPEFAGQKFELTQSLISVGRVEGNDIVLGHPSVSSRHAELRLDSGDYRLVDHNSTNGTRVNDERVSDVMLRNSDTVMFGNILFSYVSENALAAPPPPQASASLQIGGEASGRPANFTNLAPFPKAKPKKGAFPLYILVGVLLALGGLGYLAYKILLG